MRFSTQDEIIWHALNAFSQKEVLRTLWYVQDGRCGICGQAMQPMRTATKQRERMRPTLEHVFPRARGGHDGPGNLLAAHSKCNQEKGSLYPNAREIEELARVNGILGWSIPCTRRAG